MASGTDGSILTICIVVKADVSLFYGIRKKNKKLSSMLYSRLSCGAV